MVVLANLVNIFGSSRLLASGVDLRENRLAITRCSPWLPLLLSCGGGAVAYNPLIPQRSVTYDPFKNAIDRGEI